VGSQIVYTPAAGYNGYETFTYTITDGVDTVEGSVGVLVQVAANDDLLAGDDASFTTLDTPVAVPVLENDLNYVGGIQSVGQAAHGSTSVDGDSILFTPSSGYAGPDSFTYSVSDGEGNYVTAQVAVIVGDVAVDIDINTTDTVEDDFGIVDQTVPVTVTLQAPGTSGDQNIQLRLSDPSATGEYVPSSRAVFVSSSGTTLDLTLADGQSTTVYVRPTAPSDDPEDIVVQAYFLPPLFQGNPPKVGEKPMEAISPVVGHFTDRGAGSVKVLSVRA
jgi:hypothetical protein